MTKFNRVLFLLLAASLMALVACSPAGHTSQPAQPTQTPLTVDKPVSLSGQPSPGLKVYYTKIGKRVRHVNAMRSDGRMRKRGVKGNPLPMLDHSFGTGQVFDAGRSWFVGMLVTGLIKLDRPGTYQFQAMANDGIQISIAGQMVSDDGEWHAKGDRLSPVGTVNVVKPGWYALKIKYFQRKGTSTLRMYWKRPGQSDFSVIPASAYAHMGT